RIISKYRSSLCSSNAEALLCTRDWIFDLKDEDEVDEKELIDEDIAKLVRSSSKVILVRSVGSVISEPVPCLYPSEILQKAPLAGYSFPKPLKLRAKFHSLLRL
ncbi:hypothetical protein Tco_1512421, partial [Tanacetum coccineum]